MLNAEQLQWIKQRAWARYLSYMAVLIVLCIEGFSLPLFIVFGGVWQQAHVPHKFLVLGELAGFLMAFILWLMLILLWPLAKQSTKRLKEHIRQRLLNELPASELKPTPCPVGVLQIHKPFQYFPPTIGSCFFSKENLNPMWCFVDGTPVTACYCGGSSQITLPVGSHEIRMKHWIFPAMGGEPKDVFCSEPVSIEIREDQIVVMVYKFKGERLLVFGGLI